MPPPRSYVTVERDDQAQTSTIVFYVEGREVSRFSLAASYVTSPARRGFDVSLALADAFISELERWVGYATSRWGLPVSRPRDVHVDRLDVNGLGSAELAVRVGEPATAITLMADVETLAFGDRDALVAAFADFAWLISQVRLAWRYAAGAVLWAPVF